MARFSNDPAAVTKSHLRFGWWVLLIFAALGLALETMQGFKIGAYLKVSNETRRLMWTLAHQHGTFLALVNLGFALTVRLIPEWDARQRGMASVCLRGATLLMPAGFFFGGMFIYSGDPGLAILLVPIGGLMLLTAIFLTARGAWHFRVDAKAAEKPGTPSGKRR